MIVATFFSLFEGLVPQGFVPLRWHRFAPLVLAAVALSACGFLQNFHRAAPPPIAFNDHPSTAAEAALRADVVAYSKQYVGAKYKYAGKNPQTGFDCSGFTAYVMKNFDITLSASSSGQAKQGRRIAAADAQPGDMVIFATKGRIHHVALVVSNDKDGLKAIHSTSRGVVIDNLNKSKYWKPRIMYGVDVIGGN